jgi:hypothetical protein
MLKQLEAARHRWTRRHVGIGVGVIVAAGLAMFVVGAVRKNHGDLSDAKYMVTSIGAPDSLTRDAVRSVAERLSDWRDVILADQGLGPNAATTAGSASVKDALARTRRLGARNLMLIDTRVDGDSVSVGATLYDAAGDGAIRTRRAIAGVKSPSVERVMAYRLMVNSLLRDSDLLPWRSPADRAQASLAAWKSYDAGRAALRAWRLDDAERAFRDAVASDNSIGIAHVWLAQTLAWKDTAQHNEPRAEALRGKSNGNTLRARDSVQADGLISLVSDDWRGACARFRSVVKADSSDFAGWIGLGDCQARDRAVFASKHTATGFAFRSSFEDAARAYRRASDIGAAPTSPDFRGWVLGRMQRVLVSATNHARFGVLMAHDTAFMFARPYLDNDTVAYAPYSSRQAATLKGDPPHDLLLAAVTRNREVIRAFIEDWVRRSPTDAAAIDSLAMWSELAGGFAQVNGHRVTSSELLHRARSMVTDSVEQVRLAAAEVRDLLRHGDFEQVRRKGDSLYRANATKRFPDLAEVAGLAALLGHLRETIRLLPLQPSHFNVPLPNGSFWTPPPPMTDAAAALETYASFGVPRDSVRALARRTAEMVRSFVPDEDQADVIRSVLVAAPLSYVDPRESMLSGFRLQAPDEATRAVLALAVGDTSGARQQLLRIQALQRLRMPGDGLKFAYRMAVVELALGDTASAIAALDDIVETIPVLNNVILNEVQTVGALIRTFALRATLARGTHDQAKAVQSAGIVQVLLRDSDPELGPLMSEMRSIAKPQ